MSPIDRAIVVATRLGWPLRDVMAMTLDELDAAINLRIEPPPRPSRWAKARPWIVHYALVAVAVLCLSGAIRTDDTIIRALCVATFVLLIPYHRRMP